MIETQWWSFPCVLNWFSRKGFIMPVEEAVIQTNMITTFTFTGFFLE
jgi:hypothetical protein